MAFTLDKSEDNAPTAKEVIDQLVSDAQNPSINHWGTIGTVLAASGSAAAVVGAAIAAPLVLGVGLVAGAAGAAAKVYIVIKQAHDLD